MYNYADIWYLIWNCIILLGIFLFIFNCCLNLLLRGMFTFCHNILMCHQFWIFSGISQYLKVLPCLRQPFKMREEKTTFLLKLLSSVDFQQCLIFSNSQFRWEYRALVKFHFATDKSNSNRIELLKDSLYAGTNDGWCFRRLEMKI